MSQNPFPPPPYSPPFVNYGALGYFVPTPPGRVAGRWQLVLGGIIFLLGTCIISAIWELPDTLISETIRQQGLTLPPVSGWTPEQFVRVVYTVFSAVVLAVGAAMILLAFLVGRGGKAPPIVAIVLNGFVALFLLINLVSALFQFAVNPLSAALATMLVLGMLTLCGIVIVKLVAACKTDSAQSQAMQHAYYWMMQQQAAASAGYGQHGYGYGQPNPAPAPPPPPPPPPPPMFPPDQSTGGNT